MDTKEYFFIDLVKHLSLNNTAFYFLFYKGNFISLSQINNKDDIEKKIMDAEILEKTYKINKIEFVKLLYFNRNSIYNILYENEEIISLKWEGISDLSYYFYVSLLIYKNVNIISVSYSLEFIKELYNQNININKNDIYKKIILSKIILDLIDNYKQCIDIEDDDDDNDNNNDNELEKIENYNSNLIEKNIYIFKNINLNYNLKDIKKKNIDEIYIDIIEALIINNKTKPYEYTYNIISQLNLESIEITEENIFNRIKNILDKTNNYINQYLISEEEDLYNSIKINFYYILLKYILKSPIYIYQIKLLLETRKLIIKLINTNKNIFLSINDKKLDNTLIDRLKYIIERFVDSKYYIPTYNKIESKDNKNSDETDLINKKNINNSNNGNDIIIAKECSSDEESINSIINNSQNESFESNDNKNSNSNSNIKQAKPIDSSGGDKNSIINNSSSIISQSYKSSLAKNSKSLGESNSSSIIKAKLISSQTNNNNIDYSSLNKSRNINMNNNNLNNNVEYRIIYLHNIIGKHNIDKNKNKNIYTAEFIKQIKDGYISGGTNDIINIYNKSFEKVKKIKELQNLIFNVHEIKTENEVLTIIPTYDNLYFYFLFIDNRKPPEQYKKWNFDINNKYYRDENKKLNLIFFLQQSNNIYFLCSNDKINYYTNVLVKTMLLDHSKNINIPLAKGGMKIYNNFVAFKSFKNNSSVLTFYNCLSGRVLSEEIKNYSLIYSNNGLSLIPREEIDTDNKILLCACKKYTKNKKNGILLVNLNKYYNRYNIKTYFYDTKSFEVYCFCPILSLKFDKIFGSNSIEDTEYFLVGGYEIKKYQGIIKLFKIIYGENNNNKIEYIQDIIFEKNKKKNFKSFKGPISSIIQSTETGNILITCWDGNVYLMSYPYIEYFLKLDKKLKNKVSLKEFLKKE